MDIQITGETDGYRSMEGLIDRETKKQMNKQINKEADGKTCK